MTDISAPSLANPAAGGPSRSGPVQDPDSICLAVASAGEATYRWDIEDDSLAWSPVAGDVLNRSLDALSSGKRFASLLHPDNLTSRYDAVINSTGEDTGHGVPYHIEYQIKGDEEAGLAPLWVEDRGRWFAGQNGRPRVAVGLMRPINERHSRDQKLSELSHTDPLTGMMNRTRLDEALAEAIGEAQNNENQCAFAVATIRNLDIVNEAYGFEVADEVIAALAERLRAVMRTGDGIARYSGSKFGFILNQCSAADLPVALERFLNVARDSVIETSHGPVWALLSVGAVLLPVHAENSASARALAEESLSAALRLSSDSYVIHQPSEIVANARMLNARCAAEIVECLRSSKFQLAFQPLVDAATGKVACHEALLRMRDASGELVTAGHLVPVAERLGLIRLVDRAVVQLALETLHRHADACLSINLSATTANDPRWNNQIIEMIEMAGDVATRLTVEITETTALTDLTSALQFLERLRSTGCCVAIDDFGAGFTSFRNLRDLPIDVIKLDGSYCRNLLKDSENVYFARTLIEMAHHFGIRTVAEWVETEADAEILRSLGVDFLQGNHMGAPDTATPWAETAEAAFAFHEQFSVNSITTEPHTMATAVDAIHDDHAGGEAGTSDAAPEPEAEAEAEAEIASPGVADTSITFETLDVPAAAAIDESAATDDVPAPLLDPVASDLVPDLEGQADPVAELPHPEDQPSGEADAQATEMSGAFADSVEEGALESLDHAVDGSLIRLREALDLLTKEISSSGAANDSQEFYTQDAENARLAG